MVCSSGGKDSYVLLDILERLRRRAPIRFSLIAVHFDSGIPGHDSKPLEKWFDVNGFEYEVLRENIYPLLLRNLTAGETCCPMCSRLRRGILYNAARRLGCTKMALGHNRDDTVETLVLNLLYTGCLKGMPPKLVSDDGRNTVIRPLLYTSEASIVAYARSKGFPLLSCRLYDNNKENKREEVKQLLRQLERIAPQAVNSMMAAMTNVRPSHLLDRNLWRRLKIEQ